MVVFQIPLCDFLFIGEQFFLHAGTRLADARLPHLVWVM
jgi:hypothetical protein